MLEKWKKLIAECNTFELLTNLSKALDYLKHQLHISKLNAYGFNLPILKLIHDYLSNRKQRTKVNYSDKLSIFGRVPQGSVLEPSLFNLFLADLFFIADAIDIASYADDNT